MYSCDVLLTGSMGDIADVVKRSLTDLGLRVAVMPFLQNVCRDIAGYRRELTRTLQQLRPHMIWPVGHPLALSVIVREARLNIASPLHALLQGVLVPVEDEERILLLDSKVRCSALATSLDIAQPRLYASPHEVEQWPVIFKRNRSFGGSGVMRPYCAESLAHLIAAEGTRPYLIEEYVEGYDISVDCLRWGDAFHMGCYRSLARKQRQGPSTQRTPCTDVTAMEAARRLLTAVDWQGVCGLDFRISAYDGRPLFLECNPRFTGGLDTHIAAGFNIPALLYENLLSSPERRKEEAPRATPSPLS